MGEVRMSVIRVAQLDERTHQQISFQIAACIGGRVQLDPVQTSQLIRAVELPELSVSDANGNAR